MKRLTLFRLETPYREPMVVYGFQFGEGERSCAVVGSLRGNEVQQDFICANLVQRLEAAEQKGLIRDGHSILVIPCVNPFSMNIQKRFWPMDNTDINRMFPGNPTGETTQRIAAALLNVLKRYRFGIQLCSFYMPGDFEPHVRVTRESKISRESLAMADAFGLPYVVENEPDAFDTTMLNYNWQVWNTHAFSLYSRVTDTIDPQSAELLQRSILRFLGTQGILTQGAPGITKPEHLEETQLVNVHSTKGGFFQRMVSPGDLVHKGQHLANVVDTLDAHVRETLVAPVEGHVFFSRVAPLVQQDIICFRIAPQR